MELTDKQRQIVTAIDNQVQQILKSGKPQQGIDKALVEMMPDNMDGFRYLMDTLGQNGMDRICGEYTGFYQFAKMMERIAQGCRDGAFNDIISK